MLTRFLGPASSLNIRKCLGSSLSAFFQWNVSWSARNMTTNKQAQKNLPIFSPTKESSFLNGRCLSCLNLPHGPVFLNMPKPSFFSRYDLAELYLKLKNYEKADKVIKAALEQEKGASMCSSCHTAQACIARAIAVVLLFTMENTFVRINIILFAFEKVLW